MKHKFIQELVVALALVLMVGAGYEIKHPYIPGCDDAAMIVEIAILLGLGSWASAKLDVEDTDGRTSSNRTGPQKCSCGGTCDPPKMPHGERTEPTVGTSHNSD